MNVRIQRIKLIDHFKPRFIAEVIDTGKVGQKVEAELLLGEFAGLLDLVEWQFKRRFRRESRFAERSGTAPWSLEAFPPGS